MLSEENKVGKVFLNRTKLLTHFHSKLQSNVFIYHTNPELNGISFVCYCEDFEDVEIGEKIPNYVGYLDDSGSLRFCKPKDANKLPNSFIRFDSRN